MKHREGKLDHKNLPFITNKYYQMYKKRRRELVNNPKRRPNRRFLHSDLALKITMSCRTDKSRNLKKELLESIKNKFEGEDMPTQCSVLGYMIDLFFYKHKLAIEVDELGHADRNVSNEIEKQKAIEKEIDYMFIRINPDEENFNIFQKNKQDRQTH